MRWILGALGFLCLNGCAFVKYATDVGEEIIKVGFLALMTYLGSLVSPIAGGAVAALGYSSMKTVEQKDTIQNLREENKELLGRVDTAEDAAQIGTFIADNWVALGAAGLIILLLVWLVPPPSKKKNDAKNEELE